MTKQGSYARPLKSIGETELIELTAHQADEVSGGKYVYGPWYLDSQTNSLVREYYWVGE
jgi:hypothetical protein